MIRVLQVYPQINNAGTERVIFNLYENIDRNQVQFDFLVERKGELDDKILCLGGKIHYLFRERKKDYYNSLIAFFNENKQYNIIHTHTHARMGIVLKAAKKAGIPCRIAHSHNARNDLPKLAAFIKGLTSIPIEKNATHFFACSSNAAKWLFPHRVKDCKILYNGIRVEDYLFNLETRNRKRNELNISDDEFTIIHVGRFAKQKNHSYLLDVLKDFSYRTTKKWKAILVGNGPLENIIKEKAKSLGIYDNIVFLGSRNDVNELYSVADVFVFPSLHEGLGIVVIEAQSSGLPCIVSDAVPTEAEMGLGILERISLNDVSSWSKKISSISQLDRNSMKNQIVESEYNIVKIAKQIQEFYLLNGAKHAY